MAAAEPCGDDDEEDAPLVAAAAAPVVVALAGAAGVEPVVILDDECAPAVNSWSWSAAAFEDLFFRRHAAASGLALPAVVWRQLYKNRSSKKIDSRRLFSRE